MMDDPGKTFEQYRKKPVVIRARRNNGRPYEIKTLEGTMICGTGDWEIVGVQGERYPCKDDIFKATYDKVQD